MRNYYFSGIEILNWRNKQLSNGWNKSIIDDQGTADTSDDVIDAITSDNTFDQSDIFQDEPDLLDMTEDNPFGEF